MDPLKKQEIDDALKAEQEGKNETPPNQQPGKEPEPHFDFSGHLSTKNKDSLETKFEPSREDKPEQTLLIDKALRAAIIQMIQNDETVQQYIVDSARSLVQDDVETRKLLTAREKQDTHTKVHKEACSNFGVDESSPAWQVRMMVLGSNVWFLIWYIVAFFTVAPISVFNRGLKTFVKNNVFSIVIATLVWLLLVASPFVIKYITTIVP